MTGCTGTGRDDDSAAELGVAWEAAEAQAGRYLAAGEERVRSWRWCPDSAEWEHPAPLWVERAGQRPVTRAWDERPADLGGVVAYGFDADGTLVSSRRVDRSGDLVDATVWTRSPDGRPIQLFFHRWSRGVLTLARVAVPERRGDRLVRLRLIHDNGQREFVERYAYDEAGGLTEIVVERFDAGESTSRAVYAVERDGEGAVVLIRLRHDDVTRIVYRRQSPAEMKAARRRVVARLVEGTAAWARRRAPEEPVYCLALMYSVDEQTLPPALGLGALSEREVAGYAPAEFGVFDPEPDELGDPDFLEDCRALAQEWRSREDEGEPRRLLMTVAERLASHPWRDVLKATDDFVVYAVDDELSDLERNLRRAHRA